MSLIKNRNLLKETHKIERDLLDFSEIENDFKKRIDEMKDSSIVSVVGDFGMGKSVMLNNLFKNIENNEEYVFFDAWKYPERKNLWEGFILEFVRGIDEKEFDKMVKSIEGKEYEDEQQMIKIISKAAGLIVPALSSLGSFSNFLNTSPAKRINEFQKKFKKFIDENLKAETTYVVLEDIDRSGKEGVYFLETLRQFIRNFELDHRIIFITPVGTENFENDKPAYLKSVDFVYFFNPSNIDFTDFLESIFNSDFFDDKNWKKQLNFFFGELLKNENGVNIREIKNIIRNTSNYYESLDDDIKENIDFRVLLAFQVADQLDKDILGIINNKYRIRTIGGRPTLNLIKRFLQLVGKEEGNLEEIPNYPIILISGSDFITPKFQRDDFDDVNERYVYLLSDIYLNLYPSLS